MQKKKGKKERIGLSWDWDIRLVSYSSIQKGMGVCSQFDLINWKLHLYCQAVLGMQLIKSMTFFWVYFPNICISFL